MQAAVDGKHKLIAAVEVTNDGNGQNHLTPIAVEAGEDLEEKGLRVVTDTG
jgi:hypothetical protein